MITPSGPALVEGVDIDALAAAVRSCAAVADLAASPLGGATTYLPGRRVPGLFVDRDRVTIELRSVWGVPVGVVGEQVRASVRPLVGSRRIDIVVTDIDNGDDDLAEATGSTPPVR